MNCFISRDASVLVETDQILSTEDWERTENSICCLEFTIVSPPNLDIEIVKVKRFMYTSKSIKLALDSLFSAGPAHSKLRWSVASDGILKICDGSRTALIVDVTPTE
jgi:hypothetical protein